MRCVINGTVVAYVTRQIRALLRQLARAPPARWFLANRVSSMVEMRTPRRPELPALPELPARHHRAAVPQHARVPTLTARACFPEPVIKAAAARIAYAHQGR